ncbi:MAG: hypothetical protein K6G49_02110 [Candidatus Saccharibacteria bacterium]|nr:hypothetical protein [Candidatus Saccharibacteria bacterium]
MKKECYSNLFYFRFINSIGGTEQFLYELAKKYHKYDLTVMYDQCDYEQLIRLRRYVRCVKRELGVKYYAKKAFFNFNVDAIEQVEADEYIFVCHAIYQELGYKPPIDHPKIQKIMGVSKYAKAKIIEQEELQNVDKPVEYSYNPLTLEKPDKVVRLVSACRLEDRTKGGDRTLKLIDALDRYCEKTGRHYFWAIFTNSMPSKIESPNVAIMKPRVDVRPYIADSAWLVQISNNMETYCYSINEALGYGVRVVRTPLSVTKELKIPKQAELILDWDCGNVDEVAEKIFEPKQEFTYTPPNDSWDKILVDDPSRYKPRMKKITIRPIKDYFDLERQELMHSCSPPFDVTLARARHLCRAGLCRIVD